MEDYGRKYFDVMLDNADWEQIKSDLRPFEKHFRWLLSIADNGGEVKWSPKFPHVDLCLRRGALELCVGMFPIPASYDSPEKIYVTAAGIFRQSRIFRFRSRTQVVDLGRVESTSGDMNPAWRFIEETLQAWNSR